MPSPKLHIEPMTPEEVEWLLGALSIAEGIATKLNRIPSSRAEVLKGKLRKALDSQPEQGEGSVCCILCERDVPKAEAQYIDPVDPPDSADQMHYSCAPGHGCRRQDQKGGEDWPERLYVAVDPPLSLPRHYVGLAENRWLDAYEVREYVPASASPKAEGEGPDPALRVITRLEDNRRYTFFVRFNPNELTSEALRLLHETQPTLTAYLPAGADTMPGQPASPQALLERLAGELEERAENRDGSLGCEDWTAQDAFEKAAQRLREEVEGLPRPDSISSRDPGQGEVEGLGEKSVTKLAEQWREEACEAGMHAAGADIDEPGLGDFNRGRAVALRQAADELEIYGPTGPTTLPLELREGDDSEICKRCGAPGVVWSAHSPLWNAVMRGGSINGEPLFGDMVCATCFMQLAEQQGIASRFRVSAEQVNVELETTTPSGRVWDDDRWLWVNPPESQEGER